MNEGKRLIFGPGIDFAQMGDGGRRDLGDLLAESHSAGDPQGTGRPAVVFFQIESDEEIARKKGLHKPLGSANGVPTKAHLRGKDFPTTPLSQTPSSRLLLAGLCAQANPDGGGGGGRKDEGGRRNNEGRRVEA